MKRFPAKIIFFIIALAPLNALANPTIYLDPPFLLGSIMVIGSILIAEACITGFILLFFYFTPATVIALFFVNTITYFFILMPALNITDSTLLAELLVVSAEAIAIKCLCFNNTFLQPQFNGLSWLSAFIVATIGNFLSFLTGLAIA